MGSPALEPAAWSVWFKEMGRGLGERWSDSRETVVRVMVLAGKAFKLA